MTTHLETELRAALRERANLVPPTSVVRLVEVEYHPRTHRLGSPLTLSAAGASAAVAGAAVAIASLGTGAAPAFAGWTAKPTTPMPGQIANANADCRAHSPVAGLPLKLSDTRGPFTFSVYASDEVSATCVTGPSFAAVSGSDSSTPVAVPAGQISLSSHTTDRGGNPFSFAEGRAGEGVSAVKLVLSDGTSVDATVANGWFVAWWPSTHAVKSAEVTTSSGTRTQTFEAPPSPPAAGGGGGYSSSYGPSGGRKGGAVTGSFGVSR